MVRTLGSDQSMTVDDEFVSLGFAAKNRMVFEHQGFCFWCFLLKVQGGGQAAQAASDDGNIEDLPRILGRLRGLAKTWSRIWWPAPITSNVFPFDSA